MARYSIGLYPKFSHFLATCGMFFLMSHGSVKAQGCDQLPPESDFNFEVLVDNLEGNGYAVAVSKSQKLYWIEREGNFKMIDLNSKQVKLIRKMDVNSSPDNFDGANEGGLEGIALDGNFDSNGWVYLWYSVPRSKLTGPFDRNGAWVIERLSRFTLKDNGTTLDDGSEKIIFEHHNYAHCCHLGGDLKWGPDNNLWLTVGDNMDWSFSQVNPVDESVIYRDVRTTAANTNDQRGKILRIKPRNFPDTETPKPGFGSTFDVPPGNMRQYFGDKGFWNAEEQAKVLPEIYSMGHRNPFSLTIHPTKFYPADGEAAGDGPTPEGSDEVNIVPHPQFNGWPMWNGGNVKYHTGNTDVGTTDAPMNYSKYNTGVTRLPPAVPAAIAERHGVWKQDLFCFGVAVGWVGFDLSLNSKVKFPKSLEGKLLFTDYGVAGILAATVDDTGKVLKVDKLFNLRVNELGKIHRSVQGPDGAFYIARGQGDGSSKIVRISYHGGCAPYDPSAPTALKPVQKNIGQRRIVSYSSNIPMHLPSSVFAVEAFSLSGQKLWAATKLAGAMNIELPHNLPTGLMELRTQEN